MKKILVLFFVMGLGSEIMAQGHAKIIGSVTDPETNQPVEFANVALVDPATQKPIDGAVCDEKGKFVIQKVAPGTYTVSVSFIGYETQDIEKITVGDKRDDVNLGDIKLGSSTKVLSEVVVEGQKQLIEERVDRTIYNAENDITTKGGDATDVLKRVPMLSVDLDGNVTLRGSQNIRVLINNKPSTIMASSIADALKQIPADQIKTVEVITSPSAKYDAEGSGGIINIVTKKNTLQGATLNVDAGVGLRGSNLGLNGNYRTKKMGFSLGGWGRTMYNTTGSFESSQLTRDTLNDTETLNLQTADTRNRGLFGNYTLGWDYDINPKNSLAASVRFGARNNKSFQDGFRTETYSENPYKYYVQNVVTNDKSNTVDVNLTYTHLYDKPQRELSFLALYSKNTRNNDFENRTIEEFGTDVANGLLNLNDSYNEEMTFQADYQTPLGTNQIVEFGGKDIIRKVFSDFTRFTDFGDGYESSANVDFSNKLNYKQNVMAGYLAYTLNLQKGYSVKAGSRYEYTTIDAFQQEKSFSIPSYGVFVPSVNVSKKLTNGNMVKAAYNRRIQRPSIQFLNPNIQNQNLISETKGDPNLKPEYTNNYELSYNTFIKGTSLNFTSFVRNTTGSIQRIRTTIPATATEPEKIRTEFVNIGTEDAYGLSVFANVNIGKLSLNGGSDVYYSVLDNNVDARNEGWVVSGRVFGSYNLEKGWGIQFFGFMRGKQVQLQGNQGGFGFYNLGVKKDLANKRGSVGLALENFVTNNFKVRSDLYSPTIEQKSLTILHNMSFRVNFSYRIGKMSMDAPRSRRTKAINNDDLKDGGGDGGGMEGGGQPQQRGGGGFTPQGGGQRPATPAVKTPPTDPAAVVVPEGNWEYTVQSPQGGGGTLEITKEGEAYAGTITNKRFNSNTKLSSIKLNGNEITIDYEANGPNGAMPIQIKGIITGDTLTGNMSVGQFGTFPMNATRGK